MELREYKRIRNMKIRKRIRTGVILAAALGAVFSFSGCGNVKTAVGEENGKLRVVVTIFPEYDWVQEILGDQAENAEVTLLLGNGVDMHSFQPTMEDILNVSVCDLFLYVGGEADSWVADALKGEGNPDRQVINLLETLGTKAKEEELVEGMQTDHEHGGDHDHDEAHDTDHDEDHHEEHGDEHDADHDGEYDEHVWLSLKNAELFCTEIAQALGNADPAHKNDYEKNAAEYVKKLADLDEQYAETVAQSEKKTLLFADRFPFRYLVDDYEIEYYAAFAGCSAETDASFETITFLSGKLDELELPVVLTIENSDQKVAEAVIQNTDTKAQKILALDSMQSTTKKEAEAGTSYLSIMESNLEILKEAL